MPRTMLTLELAIATYGDDGIVRASAMLLPEAEGIGYVISWQNGGGSVPAAIARRRDVRLIRLDGAGLSRNRNNALAHSTADIVLPTDDDLIYSPDALNAVRRIFESRPDLDFLRFDCAAAGAAPHPTAAPADFCGRFPKMANPTSYELAVRRTTAGRVRFDERFGLKSGRYNAAEDDMYYHTLVRLGLRGRYEPLTVCRHPELSTGLRHIADPLVIRAMGVYIGVRYPLSGPLRIPLKAWRDSRAGRAAFLAGLRELSRGYAESFFISRPWKR